MASAGDVNGDGFADLIVGAPAYDVPGGTALQEGRAFVYLGSAIGPATQPAWTGDGVQSHFGAAVSSAGDVNGDGFDDAIVGEPDATLGQPGGPPQWMGQASVYLGSPLGPATTSAWVAHAGRFDRFGAAVASAGDVNGDGFDDVLVGAPGSGAIGHAFLYLGSAAGLAPAPAWTYTGTSSLSEFGEAVAGAGDVNGDGYDDVIVGEHYFIGNGCNLGRAYVFLGSAQGLAVTPAWVKTGDGVCLNLQYTSFGCEVASAGDVNGDRFGDIVIGCSLKGSLLFLGSPSGPQDSSWSAFGIARGAGDVDGDQYDDVVVGNASFSNGQDHEGTALLYLGGASGLSTTPAFSVEGDQAGANLGAAVAGAGDTDGDGLDNVILGAPFHDRFEVDEGAAFLYFGPVVVPCVVDGDGDGYCSYDPGADCNDADSGVHPNAVEICDGRDNDCDGSMDENLGVGSACNVGLGACAVPGVVACAADGGIFCDGPPPGAPASETCDGIDNDCDGAIDDGLPDPDACRIASTTLAGSSLGASVAGVGDVNGDGFPDVVAGAPRDGQGRIYLYYGSAAGSFGTPDWSIEGTQATGVPATVKAQFGTSVAGVGDLNHDGFDDFVVGSPGFGYVALQTTIGSPGAATVFFGSPQGPVRGWGVVGNPAFPGKGFGSVVAGGGDINGDGFNDFLIAEPGSRFGSTPANVRVQFVSASGAGPSIVLFDTNSPFGHSVGGGGDVNGDGLADVVVAGFSKAYLYNGTPQGVNTTPAWVFEGSAGVGPVAFSGDIDGDGFDDVALAAGEQVLFFRGSAAGLSTTPAWSNAGGPAGSSFGRSLAPAGDVNGDGYSDLLVGSGFYDGDRQDQGEVSLFLGGPGGPGASPVWTGILVDQAGALSGASVSGAGDFNRDGLDDVLAGAPGFDSGGAPGAGRVDLVVSLHQCRDIDGDGFSGCSSIPFLDCDDRDPSVHPGAQEICNDMDDDCDGVVDEGTDGTTDGDSDGIPDCDDNCPRIENPAQTDTDQDTIGDACDNCPAAPNLDQNPCACGACYPVDISITFGSPAGKGSGLVSWTTGIEHDLSGFNVVIFDNKGKRIPQNPVMIPCEECVTDLGRSYSYIVPKHKSGRDVFIEQVHLDGRIESFGPAVRR